MSLITRNGAAPIGLGALIKDDKLAKPLLFGSVVEERPTPAQIQFDPGEDSCASFGESIGRFRRVGIMLDRLLDSLQPKGRNFFAVASAIQERASRFFAPITADYERRSRNFQVLSHVCTPCGSKDGKPR